MLVLILIREVAVLCMSARASGGDIPEVTGLLATAGLMRDNIQTCLASRVPLHHSFPV